LNSKIVLHRWGESDLFLNAHKTTSPASGNVLLPIKHYKFTSEVYRKVNASLTERRHAGGSVEYDSLSNLLVRMSERGGSFRYSWSRLAGRFEDFNDSGNARL
jgi:hypothetical protein